MEKMPRFIKNIAKVVAVGAIGFLPNQAKGQEKVVDKNEKLKLEIFQEVEKGVKDGILKNSKESPYLFLLKDGTYEIAYNLDANYDKKKDDSPTIDVKKTVGNSKFILKKDGTYGKDLDLALNYEDDSLSGANTKTYAEFFMEKGVVIGSLTNKTEHPVNFREINLSEKEEMLKDISKIVGAGGVDSLGVQTNNENVRAIEDKKIVEKQKEVQEKQVLESVQEILKYLKQDEKYKNEPVDPNSLSKIFSKGGYSFKVSDFLFTIFFVDKDGNENEVKFRVGNNTYLNTARKFIKTEQGSDVKMLSILEIGQIVDDAFSEIRKN